MAATGACVFHGAIFWRLRRSRMSSGESFKSGSIPTTRRLAVSTTSMDQVASTSAPETTSSDLFRNGRFEKNLEHATTAIVGVEDGSREDTEVRRSLKDYFEQSAELIRSGGGAPRWFSPLECGSRMNNSPLLLFLPGIDGVGLGLIKHHDGLGKIFDVWCLHIPVRDRTPFTELLKLVEKKVKDEHHHSPKRPIYLVGESLGACLALSVAARNPDIDIVLILSNPATCFSKSPLQAVISLLEFMPESLQVSLPYILNLLKGGSSRLPIASVEDVLQQIGGALSQDFAALSSNLPVLADILPIETLIWKLQMLKSASADSNSRLHAVKAETLILCSGRDQLLPSIEEGGRLRQFLPKCEVRKFSNNGHFLFLEDGVDLAATIKAASFYRRSQYLDYVSDFVPPSPAEFRKIYDDFRLLRLATSPVLLSTLEDGKITRGLAGIPEEGPVLFVGYHMLLGLELAPLVGQFFEERNIVLRGMAHPMMFAKVKEGRLPELASYDAFRMMGAVPVNARNFYKLLSSKAHVLLYPGGMREALHRKGEEYRLFWPEQSEFIRMAARFGAKIVPFGAVGEDDIGEVVFDYEDQMKVPFFRKLIEDLTGEAIRLRADMSGEVANQDVHLPGILPKLPGRFYYYFGKPFETEGRKEELRDRENAHKLYLQVKGEVENCLAYLTNKRESDPYRQLWPRLVHQAKHGFTSEIPTFEI
ncbi:acyltransferase-like protein At3g26840, chloroplastic [Momordica charantia]|uniref:Acyltransferase-like protein At3g26840, chloroplastic n=1 Tax=Momordica charantia TaxID=3673 RepID=A0A6J1DQH5_MOMCH|nr:acyltransferase-like protein At3g26840, chloroplastic [Momordica charantia]XP_022156516.1 acyltransferase-like protein At3g26840, chloroplastic [Momordica charantia]